MPAQTYLSVSGALRTRRKAVPQPGPCLRIGTDLVAVSEVAASLQKFGNAYLQRVFTEAELTYCRTESGWNTQRLAARFALKEAVMKLLRPDARTALPWTCIELQKSADNALHVLLSGAALALAQDARIGTIAASISHEQDYACATVAAFANNKTTTK